MGGPLSLRYRRGSHSSTSLAALLDGKQAVDPMVLAAWVLGVRPSAPEKTPYRGVEVEQLNASYLDEPPPLTNADPPCIADAPLFLRRALVDAVEAALVGVRRVAVLTGGGIDSSVLLALATDWGKRTGGSAFAIGLDFQGPGDDRPHLRALEHHLKCEVVRVKPEEAAHRIELIHSGIDAVPVGHILTPVMAEMISRARCHGAERVLCGAGADELFGGSAQALGDLAWRGHPLRAVRAAGRLDGFGRPGVRVWSWILRPLLGRAMPLRLRGWRDSRALRFVPPAWAGRTARSFLDAQRWIAARSVRPPPRDEQERFAALSDRSYRIGYAWDRQQHERAGGVDVWWPYVDLGLAAAVARLPPHYLLLGDRWRGLLRASVDGLVPDSIRDRMDKAYFEPALQRFMSAAGGLESLRPLVSMRELSRLGLVNPAAFATAFQGLVAAPEDGEAWVRVWPALAVEAFLRGGARARGLLSP